MRPNESFIGQPVRSLQTMLRVLAEQDERQPSVVPDGIYGPNTVTAVSAFQRRSGLPVTGITDLATAESLSGFQEMSSLPMTGELDKITWKHLSLQYPLAATLQTQQGNGKEGYNL